MGGIVVTQEVSSNVNSCQNNVDRVSNITSVKHNNQCDIEQKVGGPNNMGAIKQVIPTHVSPVLLTSNTTIDPNDMVNKECATQVDNRCETKISTTRSLHKETMFQECLVNIKSESKFVNLCENTVCTSDNNSGELGENMALLFDINDSVDCKYINTRLSKQLYKYLNGSLKPRTKYFSEWKMQSDFDLGFVPVPDSVLASSRNAYQ